MTVTYTKLHPDVPTPKRAHPNDAGVDLVAWDCKPVDPESTGEWMGATIPAGDTRTFGTGIAAAIPEGYVGLLFVRSSLGVKKGVTLANGTGVIDAGYRGEIKVCLRSNSDNVLIHRGDRIVQMVVVPVDLADWVEVEHLDDTARGAGGFGSTGQ
ncbi:dUTP diphosphatase [Corynebacterium coyleae]|uniref:dUTP diphosphatase n=1 Tax=Corynebacterium coyleae TaxID=53374 RepID=UPI00254BD71E|nr:dUTP diphosphatase [Corynebacterium coyleae]MDK8242130.1 dUTP diphosphatase [Corynebacterium coyleae]